MNDAVITSTMNTAVNHTMRALWAVRFRVAGRSSLVGMAVLVALTLGSGCDLEIRAPKEGPELTNAHRSSAKIVLRPSLFEVASGPTTETFASVSTYYWEGGNVVIMSDDTEELVLGPVDKEFVPKNISITSTDDVLRVQATYASDPLKSTLRLNEGGSVTICNVDVQLAERTLTIELTPSVNEGLPQWSTNVLVRFEPSDVPSYAIDAGCAVELSDEERARLSAQIETRLDEVVDDEVVPSLRTAVLDALPVPAAGLFLAPLGRSGYFSIAEVQIGTRVSRAASLGLSAAEGLEVGLDVELASATAECATALGEPNANVGVLAADLGGLTPGGEAYDAALALDGGLANRLIGHLATAGLMCGDITLGEDGGVAALTALFPQIARAKGFSFGRRGRVRIQALALPAVEVGSTVENSLVWTLPSLRIDLYGRTEGFDLRLARASMRAELVTRLISRSDGVLALVVESVDVAIDEEASDLDFVETLEVELAAEDMASTLIRELVGRSVEVPLPQPFGLKPTIVEVADVGGDVLLFLRFTR